MRATKKIEDIYPLTPMQEGMLFHSLLEPDSNLYTEILSCTIKGHFVIQAFKKAWEEIIKRHSVLRSAFLLNETELPLQAVFSSVQLPFKFYDWRENNNKDERLNDFINNETEQKLIPSVPPVMRFSVIQTEDNEYVFVWVHHHVLFDGWSFQIILKEVFEIYHSIVNGKVFHLPGVRPFKDYISFIHNQDKSKSNSFWENYLKGFLLPVVLPFDKKKTGNKSLERNIQEYHSSLDEQKTTQLNNYCKENKITLNNFIQAAWSILLSNYTNNKDVVFGATFSGRSAEIKGLNDIVGLFINTLPVRSKINDNEVVTNYLKEFQIRQAELHKYEYTPLVAIQKLSEIPKDRHLFETIIVYENYPLEESVIHSQNSFTIENFKFNSKTNYPLNIVISPGKKLNFTFSYDQNRYDEYFINRINAHLQNLLSEMCNYSAKKIKDLEFISEDEKKQIKEWNNTDLIFGNRKIIHEMFESAAAEHSDKICCADNKEKISYNELNMRANKLASYLQSKGVCTETIVGICLPRSIDMITAALAVLKTGAAYLPIDINYPVDRKNFIIRDSKTRYLIANSALEEELKLNLLNVILLDQIYDDINTNPVENLNISVDPKNLAYIIYTSGSTGNPKGTLLQHEGFYNFVNSFNYRLKLNNDEKVLQFASFGFDAAGAEIFSTILFGNTLFIADDEVVRSAELLNKYLNDNRITTAVLPPTLIALLKEENLISLKNIVSAGEICSWSLAEKFYQKINFYNGYGPTESSVGVMIKQVEEMRNQDSNSAVTGSILPNCKVFLVDKENKQVPVGVAGELLIGGAGLARGYLNKADLTAEKFIPDQISGMVGARLYKTGDLARYLPDGSVEILGRIDNQVKLRGFRIELEEIESVLSQCENIKHCAVIIRGSEKVNQNIAAYYVPAEGEINDDELRKYLMRRLPDFMIPAQFIKLDELPLTSNGKINRKNLALINHVQNLDESFSIPKTPVEEVLANIFADVLSKNKISTNENFFSLGGHSLLATQVISRIRDAFKIELPLKSIFENPNVESLAKVIETENFLSYSHREIEHRNYEKNEKIPLSFSQKRLWFLERLKENNNSYNIPTVLKIKGNLDLQMFNKAINHIVNKHSILRTEFLEKGGEPYQKIHEEKLVTINNIDLSKEDDVSKNLLVKEVAKSELEKPFNLAQAPLFRMSIIKTSEVEFILVFVIHHIIADGWSISIFIKEFIEAYQSLRNKEELKLDKDKLQYSDYSIWQNELLNSEHNKNLLEYWKTKLKDIPPALELKTDNPRSSMQSTNGGSVKFIVPSEITNKLHQISMRENSTLFMTLQTAFSVLLYKLTHQKVFTTGTPIAGRTHSQLENLIGFFVNNLVLRNDCSGNPTFKELLSRTRATTLEAYQHQEMPFEKLVEEIQPLRDLSRAPLFQVMFVFQNLPQKNYELPGISIEQIPLKSETANYDLSLVVMQNEEGLHLEMEYNSDLFYESTIKRMLEYFNGILLEIIRKPEKKIDEIEILSEEEKEKIIVEWNKTEKVFPENKTVHKLFEEVVASHSNHTALKFVDDINGKTLSLTYLELNKRANQLAAYIRKNGVENEDVIAISIDRSVEMIVSVLAVLKAGCAFLPIDVSLPKERIKFMLHNSGAKIILTRIKEGIIFEGFNGRVINLDEEEKKVADQPDINNSIETDSQNLAYLIYTSGSTGLPKGTMLSHKGLCNLAQVQIREFNLCPGKNILQFASLSFDASVWEIIMTFLSASTLCVAAKEITTNLNELVKVLQNEKITTITLPPTILAVLPKENLPDLKTIITAGEAVHLDLVKVWGRGRQFFNAYGPTEITVCASMFLCSENINSNPPIGKPISNFKLYVLDEKLNAVPIGVPGELCIEGAGLARGYLYRPDLTAEKFVPNPFNRNGSRIYRTGDLVRLLEDGNIEFLGRIDSQVKIRGFRIELAEIEAALKKHEKIKDAAVIVKQIMKNENKIIAYFVTEKESAVEINELKNYLNSFLPNYMIPAMFIKIENIPLTNSGKLDSKALPDLRLTREILNVKYVPPKTETEVKLSAIVANLLRLEKVGLEDNFFDLGGHSLLATQFVSKIKEEFKIEIPLRMIFEKPIIIDLARHISLQFMTNNEESEPEIVPLSREKYKSSITEVKA